MDARQARIDEAQARLDKSLANRVKHLELQEEQCNKRVGLVVRVAMWLYTEVRTADPANPKLKEVGTWLAQAMQVDPDTPPDMLAMLDQIP